MKKKSWDIVETRGEEYIQINHLEFSDGESFFWLEVLVEGIGFESKLRCAFDISALHPSGGWLPNWSDFFASLESICEGAITKAILSNDECHGDDLSLEFKPTSNEMKPDTTRSNTNSFPFPGPPSRSETADVEVTLKFVGEESCTDLTHTIFLDMIDVRTAATSFMDAIDSWGLKSHVFHSGKGFADAHRRLVNLGKAKVR